MKISIARVWEPGNGFLHGFHGLSNITIITERKGHFQIRQLGNRVGGIQGIILRECQ